MHIYPSAYKNLSLIQSYILSFFCILQLLVLAYIPINSTAQYAIPEDLTGIWRGQDQSTYYVRQFPNTYAPLCGQPPCNYYNDGHLKSLGDNIMWVGLSPDDGKSWANVFIGKIRVDRITGIWVDVPRGKFAESGTLTLVVDSTVTQAPYSLGFLVMSKIGSTGSPFGTSSWYKPSGPDDVHNLRPKSSISLTCGWDGNVPAKDLQRLLPPPPGGPPLRPPPEFGK